MSYYPLELKDLVAEPNALVFVPHVESSNQSVVVGNKIQLSTPLSKFGTWIPTISNDVITLGSGYYYFIQSAPQFYGYDENSLVWYTDHQHYDETNAQYIGVPATAWSLGLEDRTNFSRDEACKLFVDCTNNSLDISLKIKLNNLNDYVNFNAFAHGTTQYLLSGLGRTIIWRLDP